MEGEYARLETKEGQEKGGRSGEARKNAGRPIRVSLKDLIEPLNRKNLEE